MADQDTILNVDLCKHILDILKQGTTHTASILVHDLSKKEPERKTFKPTNPSDAISSGTITALEHTTSDDSDTIFHIASLTKPLFAVGIHVAARTKAKSRLDEEAYSKFLNIGSEPLSRLYNENKGEQMPEMMALPGDPSIYQLLVHFKGMPSLNHRLLGPDGSPLMTGSDLVKDLPNICSPASRGEQGGMKWTTYSNINYALIGRAVEVLWNGTLDDFMRSTLFGPLEMNATTIGYQADRTGYAGRFTANYNGTISPASIPEYKSAGAEAAALGAYSSAEDLDKFFACLLRAHRGESLLHGIDIDVANTILSVEAKQTEETIWTNLGLLSRLNSSTIGSMSFNRLLFPKRSFTTYSTIPMPLRKGNEAYYMAGSAIGCGCATAFLPSLGKGHVIIVLTNTSGPIDTADHILRLILQSIAYKRRFRTLSKLIRPEDITRRVKENRAEAIKVWTSIGEEAERLKDAPNMTANILGIFTGEGFHQSLRISKEDGVLLVQFIGNGGCAQPFRLIWKDETSIQILISPHLSIDRFGNGDWSELILKVKIEGNVVTQLERKTTIGVDRFLRSSAAIIG
jgi:CubicO group peptidase (beta-lactamase class C family)